VRLSCARREGEAEERSTKQTTSCFMITSGKCHEKLHMIFQTNSDALCSTSGRGSIFIHASEEEKTLSIIN